MALSNINQLKTLAFRRISLIQDPAVKAATTTEWRTYYNKQLDEEERVSMLIINAKGPDQTAENKKKAARSKVSRAIKALVNEINLKVTGITKDPRRGTCLRATGAGISYQKVVKDRTCTRVSWFRRFPSVPGGS